MIVFGLRTIDANYPFGSRCIFSLGAQVPLRNIASFACAFGRRALGGGTPVEGGAGATLHSFLFILLGHRRTSSGHCQGYEGTASVSGSTAFGPFLNLPLRRLQLRLRIRQLRRGPRRCSPRSMYHPTADVRRLPVIQETTPAQGEQQGEEGSGGLPSPWAIELLSCLPVQKKPQHTIDEPWLAP